MRKSKKIVIVLIACFAMLLSGCSKKSVQQAFSDEKTMRQIKENLQEIQESRSQYFNAITFEVKGNDVYYKYYICKGIEVDKEGLENLFPSLEKQAKQFRKSCEDEYGVKPRNIFFVFYDGKGKTITSCQY